eukprot:5561369-Pyramimonas_sp.AAC.1
MRCKLCCASSVVQTVRCQLCGAHEAPTGGHQEGSERNPGTLTQHEASTSRRRASTGRAPGENLKLPPPSARCTRGAPALGGHRAKSRSTL